MTSLAFVAWCVALALAGLVIDRHVGGRRFVL